MTRKTDIKMCRYKYCDHASRDIDITTDEYVAKGKVYYHKDCYKAKLRGDWKDEKTKADLQIIKNLWVDHISDSVNFSQLFVRLNELIEKGVDSDYLVFTMNYIISHKLNLNYPAGFHYFVEKKEIREAYAKKQLRDIGIGQQTFVVADDDDVTPKFAVNRKSNGFQSILNSRNKG